MKYVTERDIAAPPAAVWALVADVERWPDLTPSIDGVELLDPAPLHVGSRVRVRQPKVRPMVWTVTEWAPERSFAWAASASGVNFAAAHTCAPADQGTRLVLTFEMTGPMAWLGGLVGGARARQYVGMEADGFKRRAEESAGS